MEYQEIFLKSLYKWMHISATSGHLVRLIIKLLPFDQILIEGDKLMRRTNMLKAREILRLKHEAEFSLRDIGKSCSCGKTPYQKYF